jgi:DNA-binding XRE family transcriptional regulator
MTLWREHLDEMLATDAEFRREWQRTAALYSAIGDVIHLRNAQGLTQAQLAQRMGRQQPSVGRFEAGNTNPTLGFLQDVAEALGARLEVRIVPVDAKQPASTGGASPRERGATSRKRRSGAVT